MLRANKKYFPTFIALTLCVLSACGNPNNNAISTLFIHKYGTTLTEHDWTARGGNGQIVTNCKDGTTITENYVENELEGKTCYSFPHSSVTSKEENYRQGHLLSETLHFTSGVPKQKIEYISDGERHLTTWFENGGPRSLEKFVDERLESGEYYTSSNDLESSIKAGVGTKVERNTYGEFLAKIEYKNGEKHLMTTYHPNGDPKVITSFQNGKVHGLKKFFHINGIPNRFEEWAHGTQQGNTVVYRDGQPYSELQYVAGMKNGLETIMNDHGNVVQEVTWKNDLMHGVKKLYINDTVRLEWFYKGKKVSHSDFEKLAIH
ncbi:MAG: hypothetical protein S4CHLAM6_10730 [Chlamydiae bacterium]|nr:hypothetical protein [Chlamydiota bacterium]